MRLSILLSSVLLLSFCSREQDTPSTIVNMGVADTLPIINNTEGPKYDSPIVEVSLDLAIGADEEGPDWQLFSVPPAFLVFPNGNLILAEPRKMELYLVNSSGDLIYQFGREGGGPGEFERIWSLFWFEPGEEFGVFDNSLMRISRFSTDGTFLGSTKLDSREWSRFTFAGPSQLLVTSESIMPYTEGRSHYRYAVVDHSIQVLLDFGPLPGLKVLPNGGTFIYSDRTGVISFRDGRLLYYDNSDGQMIIIDSSGDGIVLIEGVSGNRRFSAEDERWLRTGLGQSPSPEASEFVMPKTMPSISGPSIDDHGRIWVIRYRTNRERLDEQMPATIDFFSEDFLWIGTQELPVSFNRLRGNYGYRVSGNTRDDAPRFERWRIHGLVEEFHN